MKVDTPRVRSPYSGYVAPVHHSRLYVVATLKAFRALPMKFRVESESVLAADASPIFGKISLEGECEAMPTDDVRQLARENRRGGGGSMRNTIQYVGRVAGTRGNKSPSQGMFRDLVFSTHSADSCLRTLEPVDRVGSPFCRMGSPWFASLR